MKLDQSLTDVWFIVRGRKMSDAYPLKFARRFSISALFEVGKVVRLSGLINTSKCGVSVFEKAAQET